MTDLPVGAILLLISMTIPPGFADGMLNPETQAVCESMLRDLPPSKPRPFCVVKVVSAPVPAEAGSINCTLNADNCSPGQRR